MDISVSPDAWVAKTDDLQKNVMATKPGTTVPMKVLRNKQERTLNVTIDELDLDAEQNQRVARNNGGILTEEQIGSLVDYLSSDFTKEANAAPHGSGSSLALPVSSPVLQRSPQTNAANTGAAAPGVSLGLSPLKDPQH